MTTYHINLSLLGAYLAEGDTAAEPFEATPEEAIEALLDEAAFRLGDVWDDDDEAAMGDAALIESLRGIEGRTDLLFHLTEHGAAGIRLDSYANGFGANIVLYDTEDWENN